MGKCSNQQGSQDACWQRPLAVIWSTTEYLQKASTTEWRVQELHVQISGEKDLPVNVMVNANDMKDNENIDKMWQYLQWEKAEENFP